MDQETPIISPSTAVNQFFSILIKNSSLISTLWNIKDCGESLFGESGTFHSPNYPEKYDNGLLCTWFITAPSDEHRILLNFTSFETESCCDSLTVSELCRAGPVILLYEYGHCCFSNCTITNHFLNIPQSCP